MVDILYIFYSIYSKKNAVHVALHNNFSNLKYIFDFYIKEKDNYLKKMTVHFPLGMHPVQPVSTDDTSQYSAPPPSIYSLPSSSHALVNLPGPVNLPAPHYQIYTLPLLHYLNQQVSL